MESATIEKKEHSLYFVLTHVEMKLRRVIYGTAYKLRGREREDEEDDEDSKPAHYGLSSILD